jgi:2-polyprenyl-3-methyl-5-hydroxy-6-metoxy-1,4-benzoquinol methylase
MNDEGKSSKRRANYNSLLGEQEFFVTPLLHKSIEESLKSIGLPKKGAKVLDIGAGECPLREKLEQLGYGYFSLDIEQNSSGTIDYVSPIDRTLPDLLISHGGFDLLILTEVLEHVPDWKVAFQNLALLLKLGGHCLITTPFFYMLHEEPHDYWRATDHALRKFALDNGMDVVFSRRNGSGWDVLGTLVCSTSVCRRKKNLVGYMGLFPVWLAHRILKWFFKSRVLERFVEFQMRYYLGNFFLLKKVRNSTKIQS